jgi:hypothetical protein
MGVSGKAYAFWAGPYTGNTPGEGSKFRVGHNGKLYAREADIGGYLEADSGKIGGFSIGQKSIINKSGSATD